ncbi:MAG: YhfC family intramembrane metalloprotease [Lachnospiraceae bacterium]|nr:YhfC family intramembrane metalloprotease [Lachnospiraceae bacterium]
MDFGHVGNTQMGLLAAGVLLWLVGPLVLAIVWKVKKKEPFLTIFIGALTFLIFALILEKPIQNAIILTDNPVARYLNENPVMWALVVALFPGVFEETGRLVAYKTVLKDKKNRETSISHGIGHGGFEAMLMLGITYVSYISYALLINGGNFQLIIDQAVQQTPDQAELINSQAAEIAQLMTGFSFGDLAIDCVERVFAIMFHTGASIMVFYACRDKKRFWLYPLAVVLHTLMDGVLALNIVKVISLSDWTLEAIVAVYGSLVFFGAYFMLYKKDDPVPEAGDDMSDTGETDKNMI